MQRWGKFQQRRAKARAKARQRLGLYAACRKTARKIFLSRFISGLRLAERNGYVAIAHVMSFEAFTAWLKTRRSATSHEIVNGRFVGRCETCGIAARLVIDHCHKTGLPRALLCQRCNTADHVSVKRSPLRT